MLERLGWEARVMEYLSNGQGPSTWPEMALRSLE